MEVAQYLPANFTQVGKGGLAYDDANWPEGPNGEAFDWGKGFTFNGVGAEDLYAAAYYVGTWYYAYFDLTPGVEKTDYEVQTLPPIDVTKDFQHSVYSVLCKVKDGPASASTRKFLNKLAKPAAQTTLDEPASLTVMQQKEATRFSPFYIARKDLPMTSALDLDVEPDLGVKLAQAIVDMTQAVQHLGRHPTEAQRAALVDSHTALMPALHASA